jgi:hypothetical protein
MSCYHPQIKNLGSLLPGHRSQEAIEEERRLPIDEPATVARRPDDVEVDPMVHAKMEHAPNLGRVGQRVVTRLPQRVPKKRQELVPSGTVSAEQ